MGANHATIAPYGAFDTADGQQVLLAVQNDREWARFCEHVLLDTTLATDERFASPAQRLRHRAELDLLVNGCLSRLDREAVISRLEEASIANSRLNSIVDLPKHEQLLARERWIDTGTESGPVQTLLPPWIPDGHDRDYGPIPSLGQHTRQILDWLDVPPTEHNIDPHSW
jgi:formyl-CoA transferase